MKERDIFVIIYYYFKVRCVVMEEYSIDDIDVRENNKIDLILSKYDPTQKSDLGKILLELQQEFQYLKESIIKRVSKFLNISATEIYGYASFYSIYNLYKPGKYVIKICKGTACHIKGASRMINDIEAYLDIKLGETTFDGLFKLDTASCLGVCSLAPVVMINDKTYTRVNTKILKSLIDEIKSEEERMENS